MQSKNNRILSNPLIASALIPGLGQISMGDRAIGFLFLIGALSSLGFALYLFVAGYIAYIDFALNLDPDTPMPSISVMMRLKEMISYFAIAIIIHGSSIIHALFRYRQRANERE